MPSEPSPSQSGPAVLLPLAAVLGSLDRLDADFDAFVTFAGTYDRRYSLAFAVAVR